MFVLGADPVQTEWFKIYSNYGRDGEGETSAHTFTSSNGFTGFYLRVFGGEEASIYKLLVFPTNSEVTRSENLSIDEGFLQV